MAEALDDLQDSTSRLEAENRTLKMNASPGKVSLAERPSCLRIGSFEFQCACTWYEC